MSIQSDFQVNHKDHNWVLRAFSIGEGMHGDQARGITAKLLELSGNPENVRELMHYDDTGRSRQGFSCVKFLGRKDGFALLGLGADGTRLVNEFSAPIATAWACKTGHHVAQHVSSGQNAIIPLPYQRSFTLRRVLIQKKPRHQTAYQKDPQGFLTALVERGLSAQARHMGISLPENLDIQILQAQARGGVRIDRMHGASLSLCDIQVAANLKLEGMWSIGYLTSYGFGFHNAAFESALALDGKIVHSRTTTGGQNAITQQPRP